MWEEILTQLGMLPDLLLSIILGFAIGFPAKESKVMVNYRINKVKLDELNRLHDDEDEGAYEDD